MFGVLFLKECRQVLKSLVYYIYVVVFVLFMTSQLSSEGYEKVQEPVPGQSYYGETETKDETLIMEGVLANLVRDVSYNSFATYPLGFYKNVMLTDHERKQAESILERCTGKSFEVLEEEMTGHFGQYGQSKIEEAMEAWNSYKVSVKDGFTYAEFEAAMEEVCDLVGKGSSYEKRRYENGIYVPMTYEQAKEEFDALCEKDCLTRAYMRLFCDYAGIVLALSFLITEFTDTILAVFIQAAWGIGSLFGSTVLVGDFGMRLVARWNTLGKTVLFSSLEKEFLMNRGYYFLLAVVCVMLTVVVYEKKRGKGENIYGKIRKTDC